MQYGEEKECDAKKYLKKKQLKIVEKLREHQK